MAAGLFIASEDGYLETVKFLVEQGADVDHQNNNGDTALIEASWCGHLETVKFLVEQEADVNLQNNSGKTFFDYLKLDYKKEIEGILELLSGVYIKGDPL